MRKPLALLLIVGGLMVAVRAAAGAPVRVADFGDNPGNLEMWAYSPRSAGARAPLVVVLHGCTQQASSMAPGGFEALADERGFHVVYPQQKSDNNPVGCFNWAGEYGDPANLERGKGENRSIVSMVEAMKAEHSIDPARVYVIGFSAGGGFAAVLLATWPDVFAAGALAAGVPYRCATDQQSAFDCMNLSTHPARKKSPRAWGDLVRAAHPSWGGAWPRVMIIHGTADYTVHPDAADELVEQWTNVHGIDGQADDSTMVAGHRRAQFRASGGSVAVESWRIEGMGHAFPIGASDPEHGCGQVAAYFEDRGLCGAYRALEFFDLSAGGDGGDDGDGGDGGDSGDGGDGGDDQDTGDGGGGGGCRLGPGDAGTSSLPYWLLVLVAAAIRIARRRSSPRSTLPAPVRGNSGTSSKRRGSL
jgi:poly(hydroxyalkanoate) depolymerase family esterase